MRWLIGICLLASTADLAFAQTQITTGVIEGVAVDGSDAVLPEPTLSRSSS